MYIPDALEIEMLELGMYESMAASCKAGKELCIGFDRHGVVPRMDGSGAASQNHNQILSRSIRPQTIHKQKSQYEDNTQPSVQQRPGRLWHWRKALGRVAIPEKRPSVAFTHIRCDRSALWMSKFIFMELYHRMRAIQDGVTRHLVYVVPCKYATRIFESFLEQDDTIVLDETTGLLRCDALAKELEKSPLPPLFRNAVVVMDTDFGRPST